MSVIAKIRKIKGTKTLVEFYTDGIQFSEHICQTVSHKGRDDGKYVIMCDWDTSDGKRFVVDGVTDERNRK